MGERIIVFLQAVLTFGYFEKKIFFAQIFFFILEKNSLEDFFIPKTIFSLAVP